MTLLTNKLTFNFQRAVTTVDGQQVPQELEVVIVPLANPSFPDQATFVGGLQSQKVLLTDAINSVTFHLVPTFAAGLSLPVQYRAEWREGGITGRTNSQDFAMPAQDVTWDQLAVLGDYVTGVNYVQQSQVGVAGGVAALNNAGLVTDATGTPVALSTDITTVESLVDTEVVNRANALNAVVHNTATNLAGAISTLATTVAANLAAEAIILNANITANLDAVDSAIAAEATARAAADTTQSTNITALTTTVSGHTTALTTKADLVAGVLKTNQIPPSLILTAYPVVGQTEMLALSASGNNGLLPPIHYADIAIWSSNGQIWMLLYGTDPSILANWQLMTAITSVNGKQGVVTLAAADIGAVGADGISGHVTQAQVTGLAATLATYTPLASFSTLNTTVSGILANANYVLLDTSGPSSGFINHAKNDANMAYVNNSHQVTLKDGTVIASGTGTILTVNTDPGPNVVLTAADVNAIAVGASIAESQVTGLLADLAARALTSDSRFTNARTPTLHASTHEDGGPDALTLGQDQITGLTTALALLAPLTTTSAQAAQINSLQTSVTFLLGGGTPTSSPIKAVWFDGPSTFTGVTNPADFQNIYSVQQKSPFGKAVGDGTFYYNPAGANANEWVYPYITPNGHLQLRVWNEANPADTVFATQAALNTTNATMATAASLNALQSQVNSKAAQSAVDTINTTLPTLATVTSVNALSTAVANAATQASLNATNTTVATLATAASVTALSATVGAKATQTDMTTAQAAITALQTAAATKADLVSGTVPLNEIPQNIPTSYVSGLVTALANAATLTGGVLTAAQVPTNIPQTSVTSLVSNLSAKADLVGGKVPTSQLPSLSVNSVFAVANRSAMLALSAIVGDIAVITATSDQGSYILSSLPAATFANWILLPPPANVVTSVNGQNGAVNLTAANVNAIAVGAALPIAQITNLQATLNTLATTASVTSATAGLQSLAQVQGILATSTEIKQAVNYVATTSIVSLSGQQSVDGVLTPLNSVVLATAQPSSVNNGTWVVNSGAWTRPTDFATGAYFVRGTIALVQSGTTQANTIWQETTGSGIVDTNATNWSKIMTAGGPISYTASGGVLLTGTNFTFNAAVGGGLSVNGITGQASVDTGVVNRKFSGFVPSGSTVATITHGLNTTDICAIMIREVATGNQVLAGTTISGPNTLTIEFASAPSTNQYRVSITG